MSYVLTFVASNSGKPLQGSHIKEAVKILEFYNIKKLGWPKWLSRKKALDLSISDKVGMAPLAHLREMLEPDEIDLIVTPAENRRKKLIVADMDSTIVDAETLDELAEHAGLKDQIATITQAAMDGKLDFKAALHERVSMLKGLGVEALGETLQKMNLNAGAQLLVKTMADNDATCVLVSGGFTFFTEAIAQRVGFHHHHGNILGIEGEVLNGTVVEPVLDRYAKVGFMNRYIKDLGLTVQDCLAIGDGANDIPMLKAAGLGIGYRPKRAVADAVDNLILHGDLTVALYAQGYKDKEFSHR